MDKSATKSVPHQKDKDKWLAKLLPAVEKYATPAAQGQAKEVVTGYHKYITVEPNLDSSEPGSCVVTDKSDSSFKVSRYTGA